MSRPLVPSGGWRKISRSQLIYRSNIKQQACAVTLKLLARTLYFRIRLAVLEDHQQRRPRSPRVTGGLHRFSHAVHLRLNNVRAPSPRRFLPSRASSRASSMSPGPSRNIDSPSQAPTFLQLTEADIEKKFRDLEFQQRDRVIQGLQDAHESSPWARLAGEEVLERNRYLNIDPWANNRIRLRVPAGENDYINASPISMKCARNDRCKRYIATQGPKESSVEHFWQMIWHDTGSPAVIVMLTQTHEAGKEKCIAYFPLDAENGTLEITCESEGDQSKCIFQARVELIESKYDEATRSTVRKLSLRVGAEEKTVWHYLFVGWPDFCIPEGQDRLALIELIKESAAAAGDPDNPRVVHCSAGVGRSGTFIALDFLLSELYDGTFDDLNPDQDRIADTVNELRKQRMMMVQGELQFEFLYEILRERWLEINGLTSILRTTNQDVAHRQDVAN